MLKEFLLASTLHMPSVSVAEDQQAQQDNVAQLVLLEWVVFSLSRSISKTFSS
jgi:hypothetical protein